MKTLDATGRSERRILLLPNLGAEEGDDFRALRRSAEVRLAARLWALLHPGAARLAGPLAELRNPDFSSATPIAAFWPACFGELPAGAAFDWLDEAPAAHPWLRTPSLERISGPSAESGTGIPLSSGASAECVARVHDKAFALRAALENDLLCAELTPLLSSLEPSECESPSGFFERLESRIEAWPAWAQQDFILKPRIGTSGRGRVQARWPIDRARLTGALPRFAARGGAMLEPWFDRSADLSVCFHLARPDAASPTSAPMALLGSLEMLATPGGLYLGHCGEIDSRGRVFSGHPRDETLRGDAALVAASAAQAGYFGPCGVDALTYRSADARAGDERMRPAVEFNARSTMGLVALGLIRRVWHRVKEPLGLEPGMRRAFLLAILPAAGNADELDLADAIEQRARTPIPPLRMPELEESGGPRAALFFGHDLESLRAAYRSVMNC